MAAIQTIGIDNVTFSIDYTFESTEKAVQFMRSAPPTKSEWRTQTPSESYGSTAVAVGGGATKKTEARRVMRNPSYC
jgi:hypothetical protein